jgi:crotonobetainyl-CoA:carnitine CoA-transferase CaiB-like acyl-CoA transferase
VTERGRREHALAGVRVLEVAEHLAGPLCAQILGDLGADVIKVEPPGGDPARAEEPQLAGIGATFAVANRNKRSAAIDLAHPAGKEIFLQLARRADVLVAGRPPGDLERLGLGFEEVAREAPRLVYCALTGYGLDGPYAQRPGRDANFAALVGLVDQTGRRGGPPALPGAPVAEVAGALYAAISVLAALRVRDASGRGQLVDASVAEAALALCAPAIAGSWAAGSPPRRGAASQTGGRPGYGVYATRDGRFLTLAALEERHFARLCELAGQPDLAARPLPADEGEREGIDAALARAIAQRTRDEWVDLLADDEVCAAPVLSLEEVPRDPHLVDRGAFASVALPEGSRLPQIAFPVHLGETPASLSAAPPPLGAHTREVLADLGYGPEEVRRLAGEGAIALATPREA